LVVSLKAIAAALGVPRPAPFVERLVGSMRRKRLDHVLVVVSS
jgi:hypothetical protein